MFASSISRYCHLNGYNKRSLTDVAIKLNAKLRPIEKAGSRRSRELRSEGFVPGVLYGSDDNHNVVKRLVMLQRNDIMGEVRRLGDRFESTVIDLDVEEKSYKVTMRQAQFDILKGTLISVNFLIYRPGNKINIPVEFVNEELNEDIKKGLFLMPVNPFVECKCSGEVPTKFVVDVSTTPKKGVVRISEIKFPEGVQPTSTVPQDLVLAIIKSPK